MNRPYHIIVFLIFIACSAVAPGQKKAHRKEIEEREKIKFERCYIDAEKAKLLSDYEQSIKLFETCKKMDPTQPAPYYELSNLYMHYGERDLAIENGKFAAKSDPDNLYYRIMYAEVLKNAQRIGDAENEYSDLVKRFPDRPELYVELALARIMQKKYKEAIEVYNRMENTFGPSEEFKIKKQYLYLQMGEVEKAAAEIEGLIKLQPDEVKYYLLLAEIYNVNDMEDKAQKAYKNALERFPGNPEINMSMAEYYNRKKQYKKAFENLKIAFNSNEIDLDDKIKVLLSYFDLQSVFSAYKDDLLELGDILLTIHPGNAQALTINGDLNMNYNNNSRARYFFSKAVEVDQSRFPIWNQLMILEAELGIYDSLVYHSNTAAELFPNQPLCFYFSGYGQARMKEYSGAIGSYQKGLELIVDNDQLKIQFYLGLGEAEHENGNHKASDEAFENVLKLDSNNAIALNNYSYYLSLRSKNLNKALMMSEKSLKIEGQQATYLDTYGWILYKLGRYEEARTQLESALNRGGGESGVVLEHMGDILYRLNEKDSAMDYWKRALEKGDASDLLERKIQEGILYE